MPCGIGGRDRIDSAADQETGFPEHGVQKRRVESAERRDAPEHRTEIRVRAVRDDCAERRALRLRENRGSAALGNSHCADARESALLKRRRRRPSELPLAPAPAHALRDAVAAVGHEHRKSRLVDESEPGHHHAARAAGRRQQHHCDVGPRAANEPRAGGVAVIGLERDVLEIGTQRALGVGA
jgi:hypothetical protein